MTQNPDCATNYEEKRSDRRSHKSSRISSRTSSFYIFSKFFWKTIWELILPQHFPEFPLIHQRHDSYTTKYVSIRKQIHVTFIKADFETFNFRSKSGDCVIFNFFLTLWMNCLGSRAFELNSRAMQTTITHARHWVSMLRVHVGVACCIIH